MVTIIILAIGAIIFIGLFFGFKYFAKTTAVIMTLITSILLRDYQHTRLPEKYNHLQSEEGFFDQKRNIVTEDQDQYLKLVKIINEYNSAINGSKDDLGDKTKTNSFDQFEELNRNYATVLSETGSSFEGFINQNMAVILKFETEILQNTPISGLNNILSGGIWGDADPARNIKYQIERDIPQGSQGLIKNLTMIGSAYCYKYSLQQADDSALVAKEKCIDYFDQASKITKHLHDRKGTLILGLVSLVNQNNVLQSLKFLGSGSYLQHLKPIIKENFSFLGDQNIKRMTQEYMINDYNTSFVPIIRSIGESMSFNGLDQGLDKLLNPYKGNYFINNKKIINGVQQKSIDWGKYFYSFYRSGSVLEIERPILRGEYLDKGEYGHGFCMKEGVEVPCDETSPPYHLDKEVNVLAGELSSYNLNWLFLSIFRKDEFHYYGSSLSRRLLSILGLDKGEYLINVISGQMVTYFLPRLTGYEKQVLKAKNLYTELTK